MVGLPARSRDCVRGGAGWSCRAGWHIWARLHEALVVGLPARSRHCVRLGAGWPCGAELASSNWYSELYSYQILLLCFKYHWLHISIQYLFNIIFIGFSNFEN